MKAALLPDRGVIKVAGEDARNFLHGLVSADILKLGPGEARFCALLSPQGKIIADFIVAEAPAHDGGGFFLDARASAGQSRWSTNSTSTSSALESSSRIYPRSLAFWRHGTDRTRQASATAYADPRLPALGLRVMLPPHRGSDAAAELGAVIVEPDEYQAHRIALGIPQGGVDFSYGDAFPHEADMDQFGGVDFAKGCYVGQEVVSRMEHRGIARTRALPIRYEGAAPAAGVAVMAGERQVGTMGSSAAGRGIALVRLDRVADALSRGELLVAGVVPIRLSKPDWARFAFPEGSKAAE